MAAPLPIPAKLAATVVRWTGDVGRDWLDRLPALVAEVAGAWELQVGPPFEPGGNISWVAPATRGDGSAAVLKLQVPDPESEPEAAGLRAWAGGGAVRLLEHDAARWALLIEGCRPGHGIVEEGGTRAAVEAMATIGRRLHAVPAPAGLPTLASVLDLWADELEERRERLALPDEGLADLALEVLRTRPGACAAPVLLHGDLNPTNVLAAEREPWLAIDPKPMLGEAAYDGPRIVLQPDPLATAVPPSTVAERLDVVAEVMEVDRDGLVLWCLVGAVEMGAWARDRGEHDVADTCAAHLDLLRPHLP